MEILTPSTFFPTDDVCLACGNDEAVVFMAEQTAKSTSLQLIHVCVGCGNKWFARKGVHGG